MIRPVDRTRFRFRKLAPVDPEFRPKSRCWAATGWATLAHANPSRRDRGGARPVDALVPSRGPGARARAGPAEHLGTVNFATSCSAAAQPHVRPRGRAAALVRVRAGHRGVRGGTATTDPSCAIAYWGVALAAWGNPVRGRAEGRRRRSSGAGTRSSAAAGAGAEDRARARATSTAVAELYRDPDASGPADAGASRTATRWRRWRRSIRTTWRPRSSTRSPLAQAVPPTDKTYADQLKAGAILESAVRDASRSPGPRALHHPQLRRARRSRRRALDAARRYAKIAPSAPHALHMPSHTFTRVGYWQESIDTNIASAAAARRDKAPPPRSCTRTTTRRTRTCRPRRTARRASGSLDSLPEIASALRSRRGRLGGARPSAGVFALAAIPARYALERARLGRGGALDAAAEPAFRYTEAMTYFARALGAAHLRQTRATARVRVDALQQLRDRLRAGARGLLGRAGRDPAAAAPRRGSRRAEGRTSGCARRDARGRRAWRTRPRRTP